MSDSLAKQIAEQLFTNGAGEKAQRLVLELPGKRDGGGWCQKAVEDQVAERIAQLQADNQRLQGERDALQATLDEAKKGWDSAIADLREAARICKEVETQRDALLEACKRAAVMLRAASAYLTENPVMEYMVFYDEADCDGMCLRDDCDLATLDCEAAITKATKRQ